MPREVLIEQDTFFTQSLQNLSFENDVTNAIDLFSIDSMILKRDSLWIVIPLTIIYGLIFLTGLVGNVITCIVIARNRAMHTSTNYYLFSLAVSDLMLLVAGMPLEMNMLWSHYHYAFGEAFCILRGFVAETSYNASILTITAFTIERYVAICHPFLSHTMYKLSRTVKIILIIWIISMGCAVPIALQLEIVELIYPDFVLCMIKQENIKHYAELSGALFFALPMVLITVLYSLIGLHLRSSKRMKKISGAPSVAQLPNTPNQSTDNSATTNSRNCRSQEQSSRRLLKMLVAVVVALFVCWTPFRVHRLIAEYKLMNFQDSIWNLVYEIFVHVSGVLYFISTCINPFLYSIMSSKFRKAFQATFYCNH